MDKIKRIFNTVYETDNGNGHDFPYVNIDNIDVKTWKKPMTITVFDKNRHVKRKCLALGCEVNAEFNLEYCTRHCDDN